MGSKFGQMGIYLPDNILTNNDLAAEFPEWSAEKISEKIGIQKRHIASPDETALDMAVKAGRLILTEELRGRIDFVLLCTQSPDYFLPTSACILQKELGLRTNIGALDYNLGCSGFIYGLALAKGLVSSGTANCVLLITSETYSKHIHKSDKSNRSIFGDAAASVIIEKNENEHIFQFVLGTDGAGKNNLIVEGGGMRRKNSPEIPSSIHENDFPADNLYMNGPEIFNFTIKNVPFVVKETISINNTSLDSIDMVIMHQANRYILEYLRKKIKIPEEKFFIDMEETGNTVSSTIPIAIDSAKRKNLISVGSRLLLVGFGVGYSWGGVIVEL